MKADFEDTAGDLLEDKKLLADLKEGCATKDADYEARVKTRTEELAAIAETIKILNDDDALELFKKTLPAPGASLVQVQVTSADMRVRALGAIRKVSDRRLNFVLLALKGKKIGFEKIITMMDEMVELLKKEQLDDDDKKEYCASEFDSAEDKAKELGHKLSDTEKAIASATEKIAVTEKSISTLDKAKELGHKLSDTETAIASA